MAETMEGQWGGGASATDAGVLSLRAPSVAANQAALGPPGFSPVSLR